jgi:hypothetical protein
MHERRCSQIPDLGEPILQCIVVPIPSLCSLGRYCRSSLSSCSLGVSDCSTTMYVIVSQAL